MRAFIIIYLVSIASAVLSGYNYRRPAAPLLPPQPSLVPPLPSLGPPQQITQPSYFGGNHVVGVGSPLSNKFGVNTASQYSHSTQYNGGPYSGAYNGVGLGSGSGASHSTQGFFNGAQANGASHTQAIFTGGHGSGLGLGVASGASHHTQAFFNGGHANGVGLGVANGASYSTQPSFNGGHAAGSSLHQTHGFTHGAHGNVLVSKHIHVFAAPEENEVADVQQQIAAGPAHKHYRIIFIKAPHQSSHSAALTLAQAANEEKTIIYVLSKKPDISEIKTAIQTASPVHNKPEVYFIKYRTHAEAAHAQQTIKEQYDALGGAPTSIVDEGIAPVSSVVGALGTSGSAVSSSHYEAPGYLPPNH